MTVVPARKSETLNVGDQEIVIQELSVQFAFEVEVGTRKDSMYDVVLEGSTLTKEDLSLIGVSQAKLIYKKIIELTYGEPKEGDKEESKKN